MKKYIVALVIPTTLGVLALTNYTFHRTNEVFIERRDDEGVAVEKAMEPRKYSSLELSDYSVAVQFSYEAFEADSEAIEDGYRVVENAESSQYHYGLNKAYATAVDMDYDSVFVSKYSPMVVYSFKNTTLEDVTAKVQALSYTSKIHEIHIYESSLYEARVEDTPTSVSDPLVSTIFDEPPAASDERITDYDNFPVGTSFTGFGIKIGVLDIGFLNCGNDLLFDSTCHIVYDTNSENNIGTIGAHPTWVSTIMAGTLGIASGASLWFADINSDDSYMSIEHLIDAGVDVVNMSITIDEVTSTEYDTAVEYYFDYIYTSTKIVMVAAAGNSLNKFGKGGYVGLPAMCANIITVGSYDEAGSPSNFSSYKKANDVVTKPNLVAMGDNRYIPGFWNDSGTSLAAPAVTGALALLFEKEGPLDMPTSLACLQASANPDILINTAEIIDLYAYCEEYGLFLPTGTTIYCSNNVYGNSDLRERTGAGALDITRLLEVSSNFSPAPVLMTSTNYITLATGISLTAGQKIQVSLAWERTGRVSYTYFLTILIKTTYSHDNLPNLNVVLVDPNGYVNQTTYIGSNSERIDYRVYTSGNYTIKVKPVTDYSTITGVNYAYSVY